jgi:LPS O-antigen subunit length determinant protein (WzzB/FepE family)
MEFTIRGLIIWMLVGCVVGGLLGYGMTLLRKGLTRRPRN